MRISIIACAAAFAGGLSIGVPAGPASAQEIACGGTYTVARGDTLQNITRRVYGPELSYNFIYRNNRDVVGPNPSLIEVGMVLQLPCREGQTPAAAAPATEATEIETAPPETAAAGEATSEEAAEAAAPAASAPAGTTPIESAAVETDAATETAPASAAATGVAGLSARGDDIIKVVTATDYAPFHGEDLENGGMITEIADVALSRSLEKSRYRIDFINDWGAHIDPLILEGAYDLGISWFRPNCDLADKLSADAQFRCEKLAWSDPLFEQIIGYYVRSNDPKKPETHADLLGRSVCRPAGYSRFMMEEFDLVEPNITVVTPLGPTECFQMLAEGATDAVVIATTVADDTIAAQGLGAIVEEIPQLAYVASLHAVTSIDNPKKDVELGIINKGVQEIRESGKWFEIVQRHLVEHARKTAAAASN